jgi:hypothetical protein
MPGRGGLTPGYRLPNPLSFAPPDGHAIGNNLPGYTGQDGFASDFYRGGPHPGSQPMGDPQLGSNDGYWGSNSPPNGARPVTGPQFAGYMQESAVRYGLEGFNDRLRVVDRHAYWDAGRQVMGTTFKPGGMPNTNNDPLVNSPRPDLRTVNRSLTYQIGSDHTAQQDDLARPYTWLGEQGSGWAPVYGGTPGFYQPYGSRGGYPYPFAGPEAGQPGDGRKVVWAGPPHGLHSLTYPNNGDTLQRYAVNPQMRPVRIDRPSNSPQAGQSYNQTVLPQGATRAPAPKAAWTAKVSGRGWKGGP